MSESHIWSPRNIYLYLVCLVTLVLTIFAMVEVVKAVAELAYPTPQMTGPLPAPTAVPAEATPQTPEKAPQVDQAWELRQQELQRQWEWRNTTLNLVRNIAMLLVAAPIYLYHWRKIERASR